MYAVFNIAFTKHFLIEGVFKRPTNRSAAQGYPKILLNHWRDCKHGIKQYMVGYRRGSVKQCLICDITLTFHRMQITIYINTNKFDEFYLHQFHVIYHVGNYFVCGKEEK